MIDTKDISEFFHIDLFDIYEKWEDVAEGIQKSEFGKWARTVLDDTGKVIGRVFIEALEGIAQEAANRAVEVATDKIEDVASDISDKIKGK